MKMSSKLLVVTNDSYSATKKQKQLVLCSGQTYELFCCVNGLGSSIACCLLTNILSRYAEK